MSACAPTLVWQKEAARSERAGRWMLLAAVGLAWTLIWAVSLSRNLFDPIGFDQAFWQYAFERVQAGQRMYVDVWDQNAPGILGVHWLATLCVGRTPLDLRVFDGVWQLATMAAIALLVIRDGRSHATGLLAASLYALVYYAGGYIHTAQRDGFACLPLLVAMHLVARPVALGSPVALHLISGAMCFGVFILKPPMGLALAVIALFAWCSGGGRRRWFALMALSVGFCVAAIVTALLLMRWGWWAGFLGAMSRKDVPGYILGPQLLRGLAPYAGLAITAWTVLWIIWQRRFKRTDASVSHRATWLVGVVVLLMLLSLWHWQGWREVSRYVLGLMIPALVALAGSSWANRSYLWRLTACMALAMGTVIVLQGQFFLYHFWPLAACLACLAAGEFADQAKSLRRMMRGEQALKAPWFCRTACCLVASVLVCTPWYQKMTFYSREPLVLARMSRGQYYDAVTRHKPRYPLYSTSCKVAERIRACTEPSDPIACLVNEPRIYYLAQRPPVHPLIIVNPAFEPMFEGFVRALAATRPRVLVARLPQAVRGLDQHESVHRAIFDDAVQTLGSHANELRSLYAVAEIIDDICLLKPSPTAGGFARGACQ